MERFDSMKKTLVLIAFCLILLQHSVVLGSAQWMQVGNNPAHTSFSTSVGPRTNTRNFDTSFGQTVDVEVRSGVSFKDEYVYTCSYQGRLLCINSSSQEIVWEKSIGLTRSTPVLMDNFVYIGDQTNGMYCFHAITGEQQWFYPCDGIYASATADNGFLYFGDYGGTVYCLTSHGDEEWTFQADDAYVRCAPAVTTGFVIVSSKETVYCLKQTDGELVWSYDRIYHHPWNREATPVVHNNNVYLSMQDTLVCLNLQGNPDGSTTEVWRFETNNEYLSSPAIDESAVYLASQNQHLYCLSASTGEQQWQYPLTHQTTLIYPAPVLTSSMLYQLIPGSSSKILALDITDLGELDEPELVWEDSIDTVMYGQPILSNDQLTMVGNGLRILSYTDQDNQPPITPVPPQGSTTGYVDQVYNFTTTTTDPEGETLDYQFDWGDGTTSAWTSQHTMTHRWSSTGVYQVKARARDQQGQLSSWSQAITIAITTGQQEQPLLQIHAPQSVIENTLFTVSITSENTRVDNVEVTFYDQTQHTNNQGTVSFTAPELSSSQTLQLTASKPGFIADSTQILIEALLDNEGWLYGQVTDELGSPLDHAQVCIQNAETQKDTCAFTNDQGRYLTSIEPGTYTVFSTKQGFVRHQKTGISIAANHAIEQNFILSQISSAQGDDNQEVVEYLIEQKAQQGSIAAEIRVDQPFQPSITQYNTKIAVNAETTEKHITLQVSADDDTQGTVFVVSVDDTVWEELDDLQVTYDGAILEETFDIGVFFSLHETTEPTWLRVQTMTGVYVFLWVPHFSEHTITIAALSEQIGLLTLLVFYTVISVLVMMVFLTPRIRNIMRKYWYTRKP